ncbi:cytochrome P450 [Vararia minispora EC-137]|uniref:Cytochrome P450 n=1 Tax=Vararia minispora EC-137 TaxID=1314806 RepID=A0ACB8QMP3_9AGAM|nr:cytochrome P450 [Vararia minispora EC-137]
MPSLLGVVTLLCASGALVLFARWLSKMRQYKPGVFKIPDLDCWNIFVSGTRCVDDIRKAPDDVLSTHEGLSRNLQTQYTMGPEIKSNEYHIDVVRHDLTRNLDALFGAVHEELIAAFEHYVPVGNDGGTGWVKVDAMSTAQKIVSRTSNRAFVGPDLCRNEDYTSLNIEYTIDVVTIATVLRLFPDWFKPVLGRLISLTKLSKQVHRAKRHLQPLIEERLQADASRSVRRDEQPKDFLQWLIETADDSKKTVRDLTWRILTTNIAAIHTTSFLLTQILYRLAAHPEFAGLLREEVEAVVRSDGWSKAAVNKMHKVDSFIKETLRMDGNATAVLQRWTLKPFTFSNGVRVPAGVMISCTMREMHHDEELYEDPEVFKPWRFAGADAEAEAVRSESKRLPLVMTSSEALTFGIGRHACPGRFFAASEVKTMLAHVVLNYDIRFADGNGYPPNMYIGTACVPAKVDLLFRKRRV